jgi:heat shock protein HslJ
LRQTVALNSRFVAYSLLLLAAACRADPQPIEGMYRYGHEVNTVCTGEPEACYWLVETDAETRRQLQQQVQGLAPYAPVCLSLLAELSSRRADGFGLDYDGSIRVLELPGPCRAASSIGMHQLRHHRWLLHSVDGIELGELGRTRGYATDEIPKNIPDLDFGEGDFVAAYTGCNRFDGRARVLDGRLILALRAASEKRCIGFGSELELELLLLYRTPLEARLEDGFLVLRAPDRELRYRLRDWVQ